MPAKLTDEGSLVLRPAAASSLPLEGSAVLNDSPVACQIRGPTRRETGAPISRRRQPPPTHCGAKHRNGRDLIIAKNDQRTSPYPLTASAAAAQGLFRAPARALSLSPTAPFLPTAEEMGERTPAETAFLHFLSALCLFAAVRFPSRNRRFPDRCRSPDCASTAFRCRCLLLRQKLFVLPCRRLRNNYILCPTGTPTFAAARRQRRDLIIARNDQRTNPYPHCC